MLFLGSLQHLSRARTTDKKSKEENLLRELCKCAHGEYLIIEFLLPIFTCKISVQGAFRLSQHVVDSSNVLSKYSALYNYFKEIIK